jgi:RNA polymerase sigma factor (sigma-70 family)
MAQPHHDYDAMNPTTIEEAALLQRITQGDSKAFWELWGKYRDECLTRYSLQWMIGNHADAEDALSSSGLKAWKYLMDAPRDITCIKSWLTRLLQNHCIDIWKARQRHFTYVQGIATRSGDGMHVLTPVQESTEDALLRDELGTHIQHAFSCLPSRLREPSLLRFVYDMSYEDIAARLHLRSDNVRKRVQQARILLRQQLTAYRADEPIAWLDENGSMVLTEAPLPIEPALLSCGDESRAEIVARNVETCAFSVLLPNGLEQFLYLVLDHKPRRQHQKIKTLQNYIGKHPRGWKKHRELGDILYTMGAWQEAMEAYRQVVHRHPCGLEVWLRLGDILHTLDKTDEAIATYERARTLACNRASQHHIDGRIAICHRHFKVAERAFESASHTEPTNMAHWHALALTQMQAARPVEALQTFEMILQRHPDDLVALTHSHDALHAMGDYTEAQRRTTRALELDPDNVLAHIHLANRLSAMGQGQGRLGQQSHRLIRRALRLAPGSPEAHDALARYHMCRGEWTQGMLGLRHFTTEHPTSSAGWYYLARWHFRRGDIQAASNAMMHAYTLDPHRAATLRGVIQILLVAGRVAELQRFLSELCQRFPTHWSTWVLAGHALLTGDGDKARACTLSARALELQPHLARAWLQHGRVLALAGRHQEAIATLETGRQWCPVDDGYDQSTAAAMWLGECYGALSDTRSAQQWWEEALCLTQQLMSFNLPLAHYWRGKAFAALGDQNSARQAFHLALRQHLFYPARQEIVDALRVLEFGPCK